MKWGLHTDIEYNLSQLLEVFDELSPITNEELKDYWLVKRRSDELVVTLSFSVYQRLAGVIVKKGEASYPLHLSFEKCVAIEVDNQSVIISFDAGSLCRCVISMVGDPIVRMVI